MPTANVRGLNLVYEIIGDEGPWVALITGGRRGRTEFVPLAEKIAAQGYRVLLHDRRNTGESDILLSADEVEEATWADDLHELLGQLGATPAFIGGSSSGARTAMLFCIRHPEATRALLLIRVTGGAFPAGRLPENYYGRFIRAAEEGGMAAVCETDVWSDRIAVNPPVRDQMMAMEAADFISIQKKLLAMFEAGKNLPVMGVPQADLDTIAVPTLVIPGNDNTHASESGRVAHASIAGAELYDLGLSDIDVPLVPFEDWAPYYDEMTDAMVAFMRRDAD